MSVVFKLRRTNTENMVISNGVNFSLPFIISTYLKKSFEGFDPKNEIVYFDLIEKLGIISIYVDGDQFVNAAQWSTRYLIFKSKYNESEVKGKVFGSFSEVCTFFGSNVIDKKHTKDHEPYFKMNLNEW